MRLRRSGWTRCLEYAVQHNDAAEGERLREGLRRLTEEESTEPIHDIPAGKAKHR